jgi:hypothetical protein
MDVGITKSERSSAFHYITGTIVFFTSYSALLLVVRGWLI